MGFSDVGFVKAERLDDLGTPLSDWLSGGYQGGMNWLENHFEKRLDPRELVPGTKTVISLIANYYSDEYQNACGISRYAVGKDYHKILRKKGKQLISWMKENVAALQARVFVDSAPVMEREWAQRAGLGWIGKNGCLINPDNGSWVFLVEIMTDLIIESDRSVTQNRCGTCTKCIDACPTGALLGDGLIDARKCISYLTIELKGQIPTVFSQKWDDWIFGCDICQDVCPWNKNQENSVIPELKPQYPIMNIRQEIIDGLTDNEISTIISGTALKRTGVEGLVRNVSFISKPPPV
ncbi:MAG: tRNA epoxyqueuosine(34) reductase QueG [Bacteroidales bacterium]|nr:tRNA epoxyqueuosine(34) reductase QueG [Bacteroidales bacterium]